MPVACVEVKPWEQDIHVPDVPCCPCPGGLDQVTGETGDNPLVSTGSPPVNQHSCAVIQLPKGSASQVCQKLGLSSGFVVPFSALIRGVCFTPNQNNTKTPQVAGLFRFQNTDLLLGGVFTGRQVTLPPHFL